MFTNFITPAKSIWWLPGTSLPGATKDSVVFDAEEIGLLTGGDFFFYKVPLPLFVASKPFVSHQR